MRTDKVEEENKHGNKVVGAIERIEALFGFVPRFELLVR
jgi:hypothetical protein